MSFILENHKLYPSPNSPWGKNNQGWAIVYHSLGLIPHFPQTKSSSVGYSISFHHQIRSNTHNIPISQWKLPMKILPRGYILPRQGDGASCSVSCKRPSLFVGLVYGKNDLFDLFGDCWENVQGFQPVSIELVWFNGYVTKRYKSFMVRSDGLVYGKFSLVFRINSAHFYKVFLQIVLCPSTSGRVKTTISAPFRVMLKPQRLEKYKEPCQEWARKKVLFDLFCTGLIMSNLDFETHGYVW